METVSFSIELFCRTCDRSGRTQIEVTYDPSALGTNWIPQDQIFYPEIITLGCSQCRESHKVTLPYYTPSFGGTGNLEWFFVIP